MSTSPRSIPCRINGREEFDFIRRTGPKREGPQKPADMNTRLSLQGMENVSFFFFLLTSNVNSIPTGGVRIRTLGQGRCHVRGATKKQFLLNTARRTSSLNRRPHPEKIRETNEPLEPNPSSHPERESRGGKGRWVVSRAISLLPSYPFNDLIFYLHADDWNFILRRFIRYYF